MTERQTIRCPKCGREVYAVAGEHTLPGGPPNCPESHIPYDQHSALVEAAREAEQRIGASLLEQTWSSGATVYEIKCVQDVLQKALENEQ